MASVQRSSTPLLKASRLLAATLAAAAACAPSATATPRITPLGVFPTAGNVSAQGDVIALTQLDGVGGASLLIGRGGQLPTLAPGAGTLPAWANPHVGSSASGAAVVVYPRCSSAAVNSCDLWMYDVAAGSERPVPGINTTTSGETEGTMVSGRLAASRWTASTTPALRASVATTSLLYRPAGGPARLVTRRGGQQLALWGNWIAQIRDADPSRGECGQPTVELVRTSGSRRTVRAYTCGMEVRYPLGLGFSRGQLMWARYSVTGGEVARYDVDSRALRYRRISTEFLLAYAPLTSTSAITLSNQSGAPTPTTLARLTGLTYPLQ